MGGSNDPSNLIELTIEEHADAHRGLWLLFHLLEDKLAWLLLAGLKSEGEVVRKELAKRASIEYNSTHPRTITSRKKQSDTILGHRFYGGGRKKGYKLSQQAKDTISTKNKGRKNPAVAKANRKRALHN